MLQEDLMNVMMKERRYSWVLLALASCFLLQTNIAGETNRSVLDFGIRVVKGEIQWPLPSNIALGFYDPDEFPDVAYCNDGKVQVWQNRGNGTFGTAPIYEQRCNGTVRAMQWRKTRLISENIYDARSWGDLLITCIDGREERISHEQIGQQQHDFGSFTPSTGGPTLRLQELWRSEQNPYPSYTIVVGDIDNDGKQEIAYWFNAQVGDTINRLVVYENTGRGSYRVDWDTTFGGIGGGLFGFADLDNDGRKELVILRQNGIALLECFGPGMYRYNSTNIQFPYRPNQVLQKVVEADYNHNGRNELMVMIVSSSAVQDPTLILVSEFIGKGGSPQGWVYAFNIDLARSQNLISDLAVGQVDGQGNDEIVLGNGNFGIGEAVPVDYLWRGSSGWIARGIVTGLQSGCLHPLFANIVGDSTRELVIGGGGPFLHGTLFALRHVADTTYSVIWADSSLPNSPIQVGLANLDGMEQIAISNYWYTGPDELTNRLTIYDYSGVSLSYYDGYNSVINEFKFTDIDSNGVMNFLCAMVAPLPRGSYAMDFEVSLPLSVRFEKESNKLQSSHYPNPFNAAATITYGLEKSSAVTLEIYNILGERVATLLSGVQEQGAHRIQWNGSSYPSGLYFCRLQTPTSYQVIKMLLLK
jgi:hypothetical protein